MATRLSLTALLGPGVEDLEGLARAVVQLSAVTLVVGGAGSVHGCVNTVTFALACVSAWSCNKDRYVLFSV